MLPLGPGPEFDLIRRFFPPGEKAAARSDVRLGPGDDCAVVAGEGIALSTDLSVEGVHFRREWLSHREIGFRAAAAALSDLAAVAARPIGVLVSVALPAADAGDPAAELLAGARECAAAVGAVVLGGDVARSPQGLTVDVTVVGEVREAVRRSGARPGDTLWATGQLGAAAAAIVLLLRGEAPPEPLRDRLVRPTPRTAEAAWLRERGVPQAMIDLSDGLAGDAQHLAAASGVALRLRRDVVPIHPAVLARFGPEEAFRLAAAGGEDYELLFAARPDAVEPHRTAFAERFGTSLTAVGHVTAGSGVGWENADRPAPAPPRGGFQHFGAP